uniref:Uncharacterized protein n=1 Tax=Arundo donax TaxID=35708 RepID=A0A0A8ZNY2_ARUDO
MAPAAIHCSRWHPRRRRNAWQLQVRLTEIRRGETLRRTQDPLGNSR